METPLLAELKALCVREPKWTVSAAESLTSGQVQALLGSISGASDFFAGGLTAYSLDQKVALLAIEREGAKAVDCVSAKVAEQMAEGASRLFKTTWAVATTGYAEPNPAQEVKTPFAWWAIAFNRKAGAGETSLELKSGRVDALPGMVRTAVQRFVAETVLAELVAAMRVERDR